MRAYCLISWQRSRLLFARGNSKFGGRLGSVKEILGKKANLRIQNKYFWRMTLRQIAQCEPDQPLGSKPKRLDTVLFDLGYSTLIGFLHRQILGSRAGSR
jgi:hypothetical protein